jgi:hypothetical protein
MDRTKTRKRQASISLSKSSPKKRHNKSRTRTKSKSPGLVKSAISSQSTISSPTSTNKIELLVSKLTTHFPELTISTVEKADHTYVYGYSCNDETKCECFGLRVINHQQADTGLKVSEYTIELDHIKYKYGGECKLSGTKIIQTLTKAFRDARVAKVVLYDVAKMFVTYHNAPYGIRLFVYNILLHGESWYNRYGYVSADHAANQKHNAELISKPVSKATLKQLNTHCNGCFGEEILKMSIQQFMKHLDEKMKDSSLARDKKTQYTNALVYLDGVYARKLKYNFYLEQDFV